MKLKSLLNKQVNDAPEPLRTFVHDLQSRIGDGAHMIQDLYEKEEQIKGLTALVIKLQGDQS